MNVDQVEGSWRVIKGKIREQWRRLIDDQLKVIKGRLEVLAGRNQQTYGISMEETERQAYEWRRSLEANDPYGSVDADFDVIVEDRKLQTGS